MDISKATARPWQSDFGDTIFAVDDSVIASTGGVNSFADCALIVQAVNSFDQMREALLAYQQAADKFIKKCESGHARSVETQNDLRVCYQQAEAALNLANGDSK